MNCGITGDTMEPDTLALCSGGRLGGCDVCEVISVDVEVKELTGVSERVLSCCCSCSSM